MKWVPIGACIFVLGSVAQLSADTTAIGQIFLSAPSVGFQTVSVGNFTGVTNGCEILGPQYQVCNGIQITNWTLELDYTAELSGLSKQVTFTSSGSGDDIAPTDQNLDLYTGQSGNPWSLAFDITNTGCLPTCDNQITQIIFSGTIDQSVLSLYNGSLDGPYTTALLNSQQFSTTWLIPASDYTATPDQLFDSTDITISDSPVAPEPRSFALIIVAGIAVGVLRRTALLPVRR